MQPTHRTHCARTSGLVRWGFCFLLALSFFHQPGYPQSGDRELTVAVLVNGADPAGYNPDLDSPGEFQRYPERYLIHLQMPYDIIDVASPPPPDLSRRQLIIAAHKGLRLSDEWQTAILRAVQDGTGFLNLDSDPNIGSNRHIQAIFGATGSSLGSPAARIVVPAEVGPEGSRPHYIAALQRHFLYDPPGDFVYNFHVDEKHVQNTATATILNGATGTVIARLGNDPLILATTYRSGRAVHFGTYDYLMADRFGFLMGVDDLFWRSAVWAARKPFVLRGYPRLWAVQMDDTLPDWGYRVKDLYNPALTGNNPWKVTGFVYYSYLVPGSDERASVIADIKAGSLHVSPHSISDFNGGNFYFKGTRPLTDSEWTSNVNNFLAWKRGRGGADAIPFTSRSMVPHWWDLSDNTGDDMWNVLGIRYITTKQYPNFYLGENDPKARPMASPFRDFELPPAGTYLPRFLDDYPMFFADDFTVNGKDGQPPQTFFLFLTNVIDRPRYARFGACYFDDVRWPMPLIRLGCSDGPPYTVADAVDMWKLTTWRFWSGLAPVELYNHDSSGLSRSDVPERQALIREVSRWLNNEKVEHVFMQDLGDYMHARTKSVLRRVTYSGGNLTFAFDGAATDPDGEPISTRLLVFNETYPEGGNKLVPGFADGLTMSLPPPAPAPTITRVNPDNGPLQGGNQATIMGTGFISDAMTGLMFGDQVVSQFTINSPTSITATVPPGLDLGPVDVVFSNSNGRGVLPRGYLYAGPPTVTRVSPPIGPSGGGTLLWIEGSSFVRGAEVLMGGVPATDVTVIDFSNLTARVPAGAPGSADVIVRTRNGDFTQPNGYTYIPPDSILFQSTFNDGTAPGWAISPLNNEAGWFVQSGRFVYNSSDHTQQYAGDTAWGNYSVEAYVKLTAMANYPGGLRGRVNLTTGQSYAVWLYPTSSRITLWRAGGWDIDGPGLVQLASAGFTPDTDRFHKIKMVFSGPTIRVYYDDALVMTAVDSTYSHGAVALDVSTQKVEFDDVLVTGPNQ